VLRHQRETRGADFGEIAAQNFFLRAARLNQSQRSGRFAVDHSCERTAIFGFNVVGDKARLNSGIRIKESSEEIGVRLVWQSSRIGADVVTLAPEIMADDAVVRPNCPAL